MTTETKTHGISIIESNVDTGLPILMEFSDAFMSGDSAMFFALWGDNLSHFGTEPRFKQLLIQCHVYFAIFPMFELNQEYKVNDTMLYFKQFLDNHGSEFCGDQSCLPYFALPYVPNPQQNPVFKEMFTQKWRTDLLDKLKLLVYKTIKKQVNPKLLELMAKPVYHFLYIIDKYF
jgi:hypothetical protein